MWKSSKNEILDQMDAWEDGFSIEETNNLKISLVSWKDKYLFFDFHEVYSTESSIFLFEWIKRKTQLSTIIILQEPIIWTKGRIYQLKNVNAHWSIVIDVWYASIVEGYIVEFAMKGFVSFSEDKRKFFW